MKAYEVAKKNGITVIAEPLGQIEGYYHKVKGKKLIHINDELPEWHQRFVVAHQLYFALKDIENKFLIHDHYDHDLEAKRFAVNLLMEGGTFEDMCRIIDIPDNKVPELKERWRKINE